MRTHGPKFRTFPSKVTRGLHPTSSSNPRVGTPASPKAVMYPEGVLLLHNEVVGEAAADNVVYPLRHLYCLHSDGGGYRYCSSGLRGYWVYRTPAECGEGTNYCSSVNPWTDPGINCEDTLSRPTRRQRPTISPHPDAPRQLTLRRKLRSHIASNCSLFLKISKLKIPLGPS